MNREIIEIPPSPQLPAAVIAAMKDFVPLGIDVDTLVAQGDELETIKSGTILSFPIICHHRERMDEGIAATDLLVVDTNEEEQFLGVGIVSVISGEKTPSVYTKPFLVFTETLAAKGGAGLGLQRLRLMNELSRVYFRNVLHSNPSGDMTQEAQDAWLVLVESGEVERFDDAGLVRYRFRSD